VFTNSFYWIKAKNVKVGDKITVGDELTKVVGVKSNRSGVMTLVCESFRNSSIVTLSLPKSMKVHVSHNKTKHLKK
jgi:intein/homing endonuclease